jgi:antagonist of KipI
MSLELLKPGICSSIQDMGRYGYQGQGIGPGGAMDVFAAAIGNYLLGQAAENPVLEMGFPAAEIRFTKDTCIVISGADFSPLLNDVPIPCWKPTVVKAGSVLRFAGQRWGNWCYIAVQGDFHFRPWLNSYATQLSAGIGGYKGRLLQRRDILEFDPTVHLNVQRYWGLGREWQYWYQQPMGMLPGQDWELLTDAVRSEGLTFRINRQSDRMGYRLQSNDLPPHTLTEKISAAVVRGLIQALPSGEAIALMADHATTGGYPHLATVCQVSLPAFAQAPFDQPLQLLPASMQSAEDALFSMHQWLTQVKIACELAWNKI